MGSDPLSCLKEPSYLKALLFGVVFFLFVSLVGCLGFFETLAGAAPLTLIMMVKHVIFLSSQCTLEIPTPLQIQEKNHTEQFSVHHLFSVCVWLLRSSLSQHASHAIFGGLCSTFCSAFAIPNFVTTFS